MTNQKNNGIWNRNDVVLIFIDYQPEQFARVTSGNHNVIELNARALAKIAKPYNIPVVLSTGQKGKWVDGCTDFTDFHGIFTDLGVERTVKSVKIP